MAENCPFDVTPMAVSKVSRNSVIPNLQYTHQDYWSLLGRITELIRQKYGKEFNEFQESSLAVMLIDMWAFIADQLSFKIDQVANELFIDTVTEPANAMRLARLVGFRPTPPLPGRAMFSLTLTHPLTFDLPLTTPILINFIAADGSGTEKMMELYASDHSGNPVFGVPIIIPAQKLHTNSVVGIEGKTFHTTFAGSGTAHQKFPLGARNVLWGSVRVSVDGTPWTQVEHFTSQPKQEYRVEHDKEWKATIFFGNNDNGLAPPKGSTIDVHWRVGGGIAGNIVTGAVNKTISLHSPEVGHMFTAQVQNYTKGEGGYAGDTIEDIRRKLPLYMKTQGRAVTGFDYKALVDGFATSFNGAVGKSTAVLRQHGCAGNIIDIYLLAREGSYGLIKPNANLKSELSEELVKKKMFTDMICLRDGEVVEVDIHITCSLDRVHRSNEASIRERVLRRLFQFFSLSNWEFAQSLRDSDLVKALVDIKELEQIEVSYTTVSSIEQGQGTVNAVYPKYNQIIRPDNMMIDFSYR
jgi:hypothetical protein